MMILFSDEEEKYLKYPSKGLPVCYESKTPPEILKHLKKTNDFSIEMVGEPIIVFEK